MRILIVGGGGREHALAWKIRQSTLVKEIYAAPGNPGIARVARCVPIPASDVAGLADLAASHAIDLTVVGPEVPLTLGIAAEFERRGLPLFGATAEAAAIESSKTFAKEFMGRHGIPTASWEAFTRFEDARDHLEGKAARFPVVVKADGLAAGKGVVICRDPAEAVEAARGMLQARVHGTAGERILVEEFLEGREASFFALSDGARAVALVTCQDYKRVRDGDDGPNTGGMGAYSPSAYVPPALDEEVLERIIRPTIAGLAQEGRPYRGVLYAGLMLTAAGARVLEFNARFGDPEAQVLLPRMESDIVPLLASAAAGRLNDAPILWRRESAVTVVLASAGYPGSTRTGMTIEGLARAEALADVVVFHAGTVRQPGAPAIVTAGGRVLCVTALGSDLASAATRAYEAVARIRFEGMHYRKDIARDAIHALSS